MNFKISKLLSFFLISFLLSTHLSADGHKTKFKDIKGFKKQFISTALNAVEIGLD